MRITLTNLSAFARQILKLLNTPSSQTRLVGGVVRDLILGDTPHDIDLATTIHPESVIKILKANNIQTINHAIKHGTIIAHNYKEKIEITTLRTDIKSFGRHAKVFFHDSFQKDALRRDFTFNALYADINGEIFDFFNGVQDLKNGHVQFIGNAHKRIREDYLRLLRYVRFYARYGKTPPNIKLLKSHQHLIQHLSKERRREEWLRLLSSIHPDKGLQLMYQANLWPSSAFNITQKILDHFKRWDTDFQTPWMRFAFLIKTTKNIDQLVHDLALSKKEAYWLRTMHRPPNTWYEAMYMYDRKILLELKNLTFFSENEIHPLWDPPMKKYFPVPTRSLIKLGLSGKKLGIVKKELINKWITSGFSLSKEELLHNIDLTK